MGRKKLLEEIARKIKILAGPGGGKKVFDGVKDVGAAALKHRATPIIGGAAAGLGIGSMLLGGNDEDDEGAKLLRRYKKEKKYE